MDKVTREKQKRENAREMNKRQKKQKKLWEGSLPKRASISRYVTGAWPLRFSSVAISCNSDRAPCVVLFAAQQATAARTWIAQIRLHVLLGISLANKRNIDLDRSIQTRSALGVSVDRVWIDRSISLYFLFVGHTLRRNAHSDQLNDRDNFQRFGI